MVNTLYENPWKVYVNAALTPSLAPVRVSRSIGGKSVQSATIALESEAIGNDQKRMGSIHQDFDCRTLFSNAATDPKRIDITRVRADGTEVVVHVGRLVAVKCDLTSRGEQTLYQSRFDDHLLSSDGYPICFSQWADHQVLNTDGSNVWTWGVEVDLDVTLNPIIDGIPRRNSVLESYLDDGENKVRAWPFDVDGVPAEWINPAKAPIEVGWWTLSDAVHYLLRIYNADETHVVNPTRETLIAQLGSDDWTIRNFKLPRGRYLPDVLDRLLEPLGYTWMYYYGAVGQKPTLYFWKRNTPPPAGTATNVPLQRTGAEVEIHHLTTDRSECESYSLKYDAFSRSCEQVKTQGGLKEFEFSAELVPAWDPNHDSVDVTALVEDSAAMKLDPTKRRVFRDWVLNEGGDYCEWAEHTNRKAGPYYTGLKEAHNFAAVLGSAYLRRRRKLKKTLTIEADKKGVPSGIHSGVKVEIWDPGASAWTTPQELGLSVQVLDDECGVRLGMASAPPFLVASLFSPTAVDPNASLKVRVTGTVQGDTRVEYETTPTTNTLAKGKRLYLDLGSKYAYAEVTTASEYFGSAGHETREHDPSTHLEKVGDHVLDTWNASTVTGQITLLGTHIVGEYLGWEIRSFQQRNFVLTATHAALTDAINPTVVGVTYDIPGNKTVLTLDVMRQDLRAY